MPAGCSPARSDRRGRSFAGATTPVAHRWDVDPAQQVWRVSHRPFGELVPSSSVYDPGHRPEGRWRLAASSVQTWQGSERETLRSSIQITQVGSSDPRTGQRVAASNVLDSDLRIETHPYVLPPIEESPANRYPLHSPDCPDCPPDGSHDHWVTPKAGGASCRLRTRREIDVCADLCKRACEKDPCGYIRRECDTLSDVADLACSKPHPGLHDCIRRLTECEANRDSVAFCKRSCGNRCSFSAICFWG